MQHRLSDTTAAVSSERVPKVHDSATATSQQEDAQPRASSQKDDAKIVDPKLADKAVSNMYERRGTPPVFNIASMRENAKVYLDRRNYGRAEIYLADCRRNMGRMDDETEPDALRTYVQYYLVRLHLGHYDEARRELRDVVQSIDKRIDKRIEYLQAQGGIREDLDMLDIWQEATHTYHMALYRLGEYTEIDKTSEVLVAKLAARGGLVARLAARDSKALEAQRNNLVVRIGIHRLLALVAVYQGKLNDDHDLIEAENACEELTRIPRDHGTDDTLDISLLVSMSTWSVDVTKAQITMLQGRYREALGMLEPVLSQITACLGARDILTLETTVMKALLLVWTSRAYSGEVLCQQAKTKIDETLGRTHPLSLEAAYVLVAAFRARGNVAEAMIKSQQLCLAAESSVSLGSTDDQKIRHPQTLQYRAQLGQLEVYVGNYSDAECTLQKTYTYARERWRSARHPAASAYLSQLAWAQVHLGKLMLAEKNSYEALQEQLAIYLPDLAPHQLAITNLESVKDVIELVEKRRQELVRKRQELVEKRLQELVEKRPQELVEKYRQELVERHRQDDKPAHVDLLFTLYVISRLESGRAANPLFVKATTERIHACLDFQFGADDDRTLMASVALGQAYLACAFAAKDESDRGKLFQKAEEKFKDVALQPQSFMKRIRDGSKSQENPWEPWLLHIDEEHPLILVARRERALADFLVRKSREIVDMWGFRRDLLNIAALQRVRPGPSHPDTIQTLLYLLTANVNLDQDVEAADVRKEMERWLLHDWGFQQQRGIESLNQLERMALVYNAAGKLDIAKGMLETLLETAKRQKETSKNELIGPLDDILKRVGGWIHNLETTSQAASTTARALPVLVEEI